MKLVLKAGQRTAPTEVPSVDAARKYLKRLLAQQSKWLRPWKKALLDDGEGKTYLWGLYDGVDGYRWYEFQVETPSIQNQCPLCGWSNAAQHPSS